MRCHKEIKKTVFLISFLTAPKPSFTLNSMPNKKGLYAQNDATAPELSHRC